MDKTRSKCVMGFVFVVLLALAGCGRIRVNVERPVTTQAQPTPVPTMTPYPTYTRLSQTATPTPTPIPPTDASVPSTPAPWTASTDFGTLAFTVAPDSTAVLDITYHFLDWTCGGSTLSLKVHAVGPPWPITNHQFTISHYVAGLLVTVHGELDRTGSYASGTWEVAECSGTWECIRLEQADMPVSLPTPTIQPLTRTYDPTLDKPVVEIINDTVRELTVNVVGFGTVVIGPGVKEEREFEPGTYSYTAGAPGLLPVSGTHTFEKHYHYTWTFYIDTMKLP